MSLYNDVIDLNGLEVFGRATIVPLVGAVAGLSQSVEGLSEEIDALEEANIASDEGIHGLRYKDGALQVITDEEYIQVTPAAGDNPKQLKWYELTLGGSYIPTKDEEVVAGKIYYRKEVSWDDAETGGTTILTIPTASGETSYVYDGTEKTLPVTGYESSYMTVTNLKATNAGTYTATFSLKNTTKSIWADMTTTDKTISWEITKATGSVTLDKSTLALDATTRTGTINATVVSDGELSVSSSDTNVASVELSGNSASVSSVNDTTGTVTLTFSVPETTNYTAASATATVTCTFTTVYGVQWDGNSGSAWSRTDAAQDFVDPAPAVANGNGSSPFDNCMPWSGMKRVTDSACGTLVEIPKFYYKWTRSGSTMKLQIADGPMSGFLVSPAHADRGDGKGERDVVYVGAYHCSTNDYKSTSGVKPKASMTRANFRTNIHNLGSDVWQFDYAMLWTIRMLYLVEYADWNSQKKIGYGCGNNSSTENAGSCDGMTYHTGTNAANRTTYGHTRYRYIEDLWGNVFDWCDGIYFSGASIYGIKNPANFSDTSGGTQVGTRATAANCIKAWTQPTASGFEYMLYPSETISDSNYATYVCDHCVYSSSDVVLRVGGYYYQLQYHGLFYMGDDTASYTAAYIGSRLQKLP